MRAYLSGIAFGVLSAFSLAQGQETSNAAVKVDSEKVSADATKPITPVLRNYEIKIKSINFNTKTMVVKDYNTGYEATVDISKNPSITLRNQYDFDELTQFQWLRIYGTRDDVNKVINIGAIFLGDYQTVTPQKQTGLTYGEIDWDTGDYSSNIVWTDEMYRPLDSGIYSKDKKRKYKLKIGSEIYSLTYPESKRTRIFREVSGQTINNLVAGKWASVTYTSINGTNIATRIYVNNDKEYLPPYWAHYPVGASGQTLSSLNNKIENVRNGYAANKTAIKNLMPVNMRIVPELANQNESVTLKMKVISSAVPNTAILYYSDYLKNGLTSPTTQTLSWQATGTDADTGKIIYAASYTLPANVLGQHLVKWTSNIGGDITEYSRSYGIIDNETAVFIFNNLSVPSMRTEFYSRYLPFNTWESKTINSLHWTSTTINNASNWANVSKEYRQYGISPGFMVQCAPWGASQIREESTEFQTALLSGFKDIAPYFGFNQDEVNFGDYGMGKTTVEVARNLGYKYVHSIVTNNHIDGSFGINQAGKPERPYFISSEDFRKPNKETKPLLGFAQHQHHNPLGIKYFSHYMIGGGEFRTVDRTSTQQQAGGDLNTYFSRIINKLDAFNQNIESQKVPYFMQMNYQFEGKNTPVVEACKMVMDYILNKAKKQKVVFATNNGAADYFLNHYTKLPETTTYFQDVFAGFTVGQKPANYPDYMQIENQDQMVISLYGQLLPDNFYDYTTPWNYPDCGDYNIPRARSGWGTIPDEDNIYKFEIFPKIVDTRNFTVSEVRRNSDGKISVTVHATVAQKNLPISLWDIAREFSKDDAKFTVTGGGRFVPVKSPFTGNLNGYLIASVAVGKNTFTLNITTPQRAIQSVEFEVGDAIKGKVFETNGRKDAYIWNKYPWDTKVKINIPQGSTMDVYVSPLSAKQTLNPGYNVINIPYGERMQIVGYSKDGLTNMITADD